jgi:hypothetical protein
MLPTTFPLPDTVAGWATLLAPALLLWVYDRVRSASRLPTPPGPKPWPFIGNLLDMPEGNDWLVYHKWAQAYGRDTLFVPVSSGVKCDD